MPAMFKANERCYKRTFGLYGLEALNYRSELKILWDTFRSQIAERWFPYDRRITNDHRRSQKIEHGSIFCDRLRSGIRDRLRSFGNQPLGLHGTSRRFETSLTRCLLEKKNVIKIAIPSCALTCLRSENKGMSMSAHNLFPLL